MASLHQKHPIPKVANSIFSFPPVNDSNSNIENNIFISSLAFNELREQTQCNKCAGASIFEGMVVRKLESVVACHCIESVVLQNAA